MYKQNDLFKDGPSLFPNACVGKNGGPYGFDAYALGYFMAGECLFKSIVQGYDEISVDLIVYPIVFLYRHAIELAIKQLIITLPRIWNNMGCIEHTHKLLDNWKTVKRYLERDSSFDPDGTLVPLINKILNDFVDIDSKGEVFRFPHTKKGNRHLQNKNSIDIEAFGNAMNTVKDAFEFWMWMADELWDMQCELRN